MDDKKNNSDIVKEFNNSDKQIFVVYGKVDNFDPTIKEFENHFESQNTKILKIDIKLANRENFADTFFEIISLFGDELSKRIDSDSKADLDDTLRNFRDRYRQIIDKQEDDKLAKLSGFYEYVLYPLLENIFDSKDNIQIIFKGFEQISDWGSKLNTHFLEKLSEIFSIIILHNDFDKPKLFYGSKEGRGTENIEFYLIPNSIMKVRDKFISSSEKEAKINRYLKILSIPIILIIIFSVIFYFLYKENFSTIRKVKSIPNERIILVYKYQKYIGINMKEKFSFKFTNSYNDTIKRITLKIVDKKRQLDIFNSTGESVTSEIYFGDIPSKVTSVEKKRFIKLIEPEFSKNLDTYNLRLNISGISINNGKFSEEIVLNPPINIKKHYIYWIIKICFVIGTLNLAIILGIIIQILVIWEKLKNLKND